MVLVRRIHQRDGLLDTYRGLVCECPVVNGVRYEGDGYTDYKAVGPGRCTLNNGGCWSETRGHRTFSTCSVSQSMLAFLASAESPPLLSLLPNSSSEQRGLLIIGPEGDFTEAELDSLKVAGAVPVGLGPCRLQVETATISLLSALMLWSDAKNKERQECR